MTRQPGNVLVHADGRFLLADFDVSKDTLGANASGGGAAARGLARDTGGGGDVGSGPVSVTPGPPGNGSSRGGGGVRGAMEAETTRTSLAGTSGFMAPEVLRCYVLPYIILFFSCARRVFYLLSVGVRQAISLSTHRRLSDKLCRDM